MNMNERQVVSITEANEEAPMELTDDEKIDIAARRVLARYHKAFEVK